MSVKPINRALVFNTTKPLGAAGTYTTPGINADTFKRISGIVSANLAGTLEVFESANGSDWFKVKSISVSANTPLKFDEVVGAGFVQLKFINGDGITAQTSFTFAGYSNVN